jgi:glycosyltransferase involved in cell wall biosynthesis
MEVIALEHEDNRGKGEALKTGFDFAAKRDFAAVITLDADLQHAPESIPAFIEAYREATCDIVVGARNIALSVMPFARWWTNRTTSWIISKMVKQRITDSQSGYRLIATRVWQNIPLSTTGYDLESEILIKAGKMGYRIGEVPIETIYTGGKSYINPWADTWRFIKLVWRNLGN